MTLTSLPASAGNIHIQGADSPRKPSSESPSNFRTAPFWLSASYLFILIAAIAVRWAS